MRGTVFMMSANVVFCVMACLVRELSALNAWTTTLFRFLLGIGILGIFAMSGKVRLQFVNSRGLFVRGFIGGCATAIFFFSIPRLGLVRAGFIASLYPAFATVFGYFFLKERLSPLKWTALAVALVGVGILMGNPSGRAGLSQGISRYDLFALFGTMLAGLTVVSIKRLQTTDSTVAIFFAQCLVGSLIVFVPASVHAAAIQPGTLVALLMIGILATAGQLLSTDSYRYLSVSTGSLLVMTSPVFNCLAGLFIFHEPFSLRTAVGALVIMVSSAVLILDKNVDLCADAHGGRDPVLLVNASERGG